MAEAPATLPEGRYGRSRTAEARSDRRLKATGLVLGVLLLGFTVWAGASYIADQDVTGELTGFDVVSETEVEVSVAVRKPADVVGVCTLRARAEDGLEVGRATVRFEDDTDRIHRSVTLKTTERATTAELLGCDSA